MMYILKNFICSSDGCSNLISEHSFDKQYAPPTLGSLQHQEFFLHSPGAEQSGSSDLTIVPLSHGTANTRMKTPSKDINNITAKILIIILLFINILYNKNDKRFR